MARRIGVAGAAGALAMGVLAGTAGAQTESIFMTVPPAGAHLEFTNTAGAGGFTQFSMFGAATHADAGPPPALHTLVIVFEWRIAPGPEHDFAHWGQSPDNITTVIGGMTNFFSTGVFTTPGAWDTVAVHMYCGFPITVSASFDHSWTPTPAPGALGVLGVAGVLASRRRR